MASFNMLFSTMHEEASSDTENDNNTEQHTGDHTKLNDVDNEVEEESVKTNRVETVLENAMNGNTIGDDMEVNKEETINTPTAQTEVEKDAQGDAVDAVDEGRLEKPEREGMN